MRKRSLACLCLLLTAVLLLSGCDGTGGDEAATQVPEMTSAPTLPPQNPTDIPPAGDEPEDPEEDAALSGGEEPDGSGTQGVFQANAGVAAGPGLPATPSPTPSPTSAVRLTPDPSEKPIAVDPIDKPTQVPLTIAYINYSSQPMGVSFDRPAGWKEESPADSNVLFTEPASAARNGYYTKLTVRVIHSGSKQTKSDAQDKLLELLEELGQSTEWTDFKASSTDSASMGGADGYYAYYNAVYNGINLRGRMMVVARGNALYVVRITTSQEFYLLYEEDVYRKVRATWKFI